MAIVARAIIFACVLIISRTTLSKYADLFARLANLTNKQYATAGFLTSNAFNPNGSFRPDAADWTNENAVAPGQPRAIWAGVRIRWE